MDSHSYHYDSTLLDAHFRRPVRFFNFLSKQSCLYKVAIYGLFSLALSGCIGEGYDSPEMAQAALDRYLSLWLDKKPEEYSYTLSYEPDNLREENIWHNIEQDGQLETIQLRNAYENLSTISINDLFELIQSAIDDNYYGVTVTYDSYYGYPTSVHLLSERIASTVNKTIEISNFLEVGSPKYQITQNYVKWQAARINDYEIGIKVICECDSNNSFNVTVIDRIERDITFSDGSEIVERDNSIPMTIEGAFYWISLFPPSSLEIEYHETLGYPTYIMVDEAPGVSGDETTLIISNFEPYQEYTTAELDQQIEKWNAIQPESIHYSYQKFYFGEIERPGNVFYRVTLEDGVVQSTQSHIKFPTSTTLKKIPYSAKSIEEVFQLVRDIIDSDVYELQIIYHDTYGFPTYIHVDPSYDKKLDEYSFSISEIDGTNGAINELYQNWEVWKEHNLTDYNFSYTTQYVSPDNKSMNHRTYYIEVRNAVPVFGSVDHDGLIQSLRTFEFAAATPGELIYTILMNLNRFKPLEGSAISYIEYNTSYNFPERIELSSEVENQNKFRLEVTGFELASGNN